MHRLASVSHENIPEETVRLMDAIIFATFESREAELRPAPSSLVP